MIPLAKDTSEVIGKFAEKVQNRSLLFEKMVLPKTWGHNAKFNEAQRFNVLRATHNGGRLLQEEAKAAHWKAGKGGRNADQEKYKAEIAGALATIQSDNPNLTKSRITSTLHFQKALYKSYSDRCAIFVGKLGGRLLINMGGGVQENAGLALDRLTGLPYIPGSAIKGITRHTALWEIRDAQDDPMHQKQLLQQALLIFGFTTNDLKGNGDFLWAVHKDKGRLATVYQDIPTTNQSYKGICAFLTAHPASEQNLRIVAEVLTPHINNNLRPIFFPAVEVGSEFTFAIVVQRLSSIPNFTTEKLLTTAKTWLQAALVQNGIGAKTGAGYGWFQINPQYLGSTPTTPPVSDPLVSPKPPAPPQSPMEIIIALNDQDFNEFAKNISEKSREDQLVFFEVLQSSVKKDRRKQWKKKKPDLWSVLIETAKSLNIDLS